MLDLLFFAAIAAFLAFRFYNTIGKKDHSPDEKVMQKIREVQRKAQQDEDKVVTLRPDEVKLVDETPLDEELQTSVAMIHKYEPDFDPALFLEGSKRAFEMILKAYEKGDKNTLENLLDDDIYQEFAKDIDARAKEGKSLIVTIVSGPTALLEAIEVRGKEARITVEFDSREIRLIKDEKGRILEGDPSDAEAVKDLWTFSKKLDKKTKIWKLVDTEAA